MKTNPAQSTNAAGHQPRCASLFSQMLSLIDRREFDAAVIRTRSEQRTKGFSCWDQFVAMMFCQLAQAKSLREITQGLASCEAGCAISDWPSRQHARRSVTPMR